VDRGRAWRCTGCSPSSAIDRSPLAVAHKKFLLARLADTCMLGAAIAFGSTFDTLRIDAIVADVVAAASLPAGARVAILLVALAAVVKCAQLPFHGWLIQVMEAPTPVSALLHAGVVNLGGFVLLRFAPSSTGAWRLGHCSSWSACSLRWSPRS
jgi:NADH:ubiquinone oxidoreductase subunit 5 (subunit L)/multisubunit Na+/H+ antiporter MnhA subunit